MGKQKNNIKKSSSFNEALEKYSNMKNHARKTYKRIPKANRKDIYVDLGHATAMVHAECILGIKMTDDY